MHASIARSVPASNSDVAVIGAGSALAMALQLVLLLLLDCSARVSSPSSMVMIADANGLEAEAWAPTLLDWLRQQAESRCLSLVTPSSAEMGL